ncbi:hypothetical protein L9F63_024353, partial [Diploptera punctata]
LPLVLLPSIGLSSLALFASRLTFPSVCRILFPSLIRGLILGTASNADRLHPAAEISLSRFISELSLLDG